MPVARPPLRESHLAAPAFKRSLPGMASQVILERVEVFEFVAARLTHHDLVITAGFLVHEPTLNH